MALNIESHLWKIASGLATGMTYPLIYSMTVDRVMLGIRMYVPEFCGMEPGDRVLDVCLGQVTGMRRHHLVAATGFEPVTKGS